ncbi:MAG: response regulator [Deltaproteobacteria bacterium]|nr:response regulator [Deltaproteobacteria bacterium]
MDILIAEDDTLILDLLVESLDIPGHTVTTARDGQEAWHIYQTKSIQMVITDWMMPRMNGMELCRNIRAASRDHYTYIIVITGKAQKEDLLETLKCGADDCIKKPFDPDELVARIKAGERIINLEEAHKDLQQVLIESRNKLRIVLDSLPEKIVAIDADFRIVSMNFSFVKRKGVDLRETIGTPCFQEKYWGMENVRIQAIMAHAREVFNSGLPILIRETTDDGVQGKRHVELHLLPIMLETGKVVQVAIVSRDVTDEQRKADEIRSLNRRLQSAVVQIREKNIKLADTLKELKGTQSQMVQAEKMASIGQLAAGVAHEINNPVGFVSSNLKSLTDYQKDLRQIISAYDQFMVQLSCLKDSGLDLPGIETMAAQLREKASDLDVGYILEDIPSLIEESREGLDRIKKIVLDLKDFSHPGEDILKMSDLNLNLDSTLNIVWNELKYKATILKAYSADLPQIRCYPQQLNQVFMNILVNAAQAIEKQGEIRIATREATGFVEIVISDTGQGIPKENLSRIYDPFFTSKEVGKGTGLGLNVAYNIIKKHQGTIDVQSEVGKGTTFTIRIPVNGPETSLSDSKPGNA